MSPQYQGEFRKNYIIQRIQNALNPIKEDKDKEKTIEDYVLNKSLSYNANLNENYINYIVDRLKRSTVDLDYQKDLFEKVLILQSNLSADLLSDSSSNYSVHDVQKGNIDNKDIKRILIEQLKKRGISYTNQTLDKFINESKTKSNFLFSISYQALNVDYNIVEDNKNSAEDDDDNDVDTYDIFIDEDYLNELKQNDDIERLQKIFDLASEIQNKLTSINVIPNQIKLDDIKNNKTAFVNIINEIRSKYNFDMDDDKLNEAISFALDPQYDKKAEFSFNLAYYIYINCKTSPVIPQVQEETPEIKTEEPELNNGVADYETQPDEPERKDEEELELNNGVADYENMPDEDDNESLVNEHNIKIIRRYYKKKFNLNESNYREEQFSPYITRFKEIVNKEKDLNKALKIIQNEIKSDYNTYVAQNQNKKSVIKEKEDLDAIADRFSFYFWH